MRQCCFDSNAILFVLPMMSMAVIGIAVIMAVVVAVPPMLLMAMVVMAVVMPTAIILTTHKELRTGAGGKCWRVKVGWA